MSSPLSVERGYHEREKSTLPCTAHAANPPSGKQWPLSSCITPKRRATGTGGGLELCDSASATLLSICARLYQVYTVIHTWCVKPCIFGRYQTRYRRMYSLARRSSAGKYYVALHDPRSFAAVQGNGGHQVAVSRQQEAEQVQEESLMTVPVPLFSAHCVRLYQAYNLYVI